MKCISLWQPWATLMAIGAKTIETRSWRTDHRGPLAIHAAKKWSGELHRIGISEPFFAALRKEYGLLGAAILGPQVMPFGAIVAVVDVTGCCSTAGLQNVSGDERAFGDYQANRFGWITDPTKLRRLDKPVPWKGSQGFFEVPDEVIK